ncbi:hypothetical protein TELCIR_22109, partial [Teladorsagia circumcincta]
YLQLEVDDDSKQLLKINTHQGLYRFDRLLFRMKPLPGIFQQCTDALIAGLDGTAAYLDDILVTSRTIDEHNTQLDAVLLRMQDYGFSVRLEKCSFLQTQISILASSTTQKDDALIQIRAKPSKDAFSASAFSVTQLRAYLINFSGNFLEDLHSLRAP